MQEITLNLRKSKYLFPSAIFLVFACHFFLFISKFSVYVIDDAYIHLRIARNIATHGLPYFNLDEPILGSSPHLWINLLAILLKIFPNPADFLPTLNWVFTLGSFSCGILLLNKRFSQTMAVFLAGIATSVLLLPSAAGLMETPLAIFIFLLTFVFLERNQYLLAGLAMACAIWVRFEYFALPVLALLFLQTKQNRMELVKGLAAPLFIYFSYCLWYFGTIVPFPAIAKPQVFTITLREFFTQMPAVTNYPITSKIISVNIKWILIVLSQSLLFIGMLWLGIKNRSKNGAFLMCIFSLAVLSVYVLKRVYVFSWYTPLFTIPLAFSLLLLPTKKYLGPLTILFIVGFVNVFIIAGSDHMSLFTGHEKYYDEYAPGKRVQKYLEIGRDLYEKFPHATLMTAEIGALGWSFPGKILDGAALVSPEILQYHPLPVPQDRDWNMAGAIPAKAVQALQPDLIVTMPTFGRAVLREVQNHALPYELISSSAIIPLWGSEKIEVYKRVSNAN